MAWEYFPATAEAGAWAGTVLAEGRLASWPDTDTPVTLLIDAGVSDRAGLLSAATETRLSLLGSCGGERPPRARRGESRRCDLGTRPTAGERCALRKRRLRVIGPFVNGWCPDGAGLAGRVVT